MNEPRPTQNLTPRELARRRRAKRGLVASYIRELSARTNGNGLAPQQVPAEQSQAS